MKRLSFLLIAAFLLLLSGCGGYIGSINTGLNRESVDLGISPAPLGFSYDINQDTGAVTFTVPSHILYFTSRAGAIGATVEGYTIEFYDSSGNPLFPGDHVVNSTGALNVYVPAGLTCTNPLPVNSPDPRNPGVPGETLGCRFDSEGVRYARGPAVNTPNMSLTPITIASADFDLLFRGGAVGAYADFYIYGTNDLGNDFRAGPYSVAIQVPLGDDG